MMPGVLTGDIGNHLYIDLAHKRSWASCIRQRVATSTSYIQSIFDALAVHQRSCLVLVIEDHCSRLDTYSWFTLGLIQGRVLERNMRAASWYVWLLAGIDLNEEKHIVRLLVKLVVVTMRLLWILRRANLQGLSCVIREDQWHLDNVLVRDRRSVGDSKRVSGNWFARSPHLAICCQSSLCPELPGLAHVDDLKTRLLEELRCLVP